MNKLDSLTNARCSLAELHREVSELWLLARKCAGVDTAQFDEQFDVVTSTLLGLGVSLDSLLGDRLRSQAPEILRRLDEQAADDDDDALDPSDPQRMNVANWENDSA